MSAQVVDVQELVNRMVKYLIEGLAVSLAAGLLPSKSLKGPEIMMIALTASAVFAVLDMWSPAVAGGARHGAGFGIGTGLVGGLSVGGGGGARSPSV